jgi:hypothetical protein
MTPETRTALEGSIEKWRGVLAGTTKERGTLNCPLCHLFNQHAFIWAELNPDKDLELKRCKVPRTCRGCPVEAATGVDNCQRTPYIDYVAAEIYGDEDAMHAAAAAELYFLTSLLPK